MRPQADEYPEQVEHVIQALLAGGIEAGRQALEPIAYAPRPIDRRPAVSRPIRCRVWRRDGFRCRYCDGEVIPNSLLELLSDIYPDVFPYHRNWKGGQTHPVVIARSAMVDHVVPGSAGGSWSDEANLVTACNPCNAIKADFTLAQLGWELLPISEDEWDGLTHHYPALWRVAGMPKPSYHLGFIRDLGLTVE